MTSSDMCFMFYVLCFIACVFAYTFLSIFTIAHQNFHVSHRYMETLKTQIYRVFFD